MIHLIGTLITVASIAGLGVLIEGATDVRRRLLSYVHARRAKPSREGQTDEKPQQVGDENASSEDDQRST